MIANKIKQLQSTIDGLMKSATASRKRADEAERQVRDLARDRDQWRRRALAAEAMANSTGCAS